MPAKIRNNDWDKYFDPKYRSSGPLKTILWSAVILGALGALGYGGLFFKDQLEKKQLAQQERALALAPTQTAIAYNATLEAGLANQPTAAPLEQGRVIQQTALLEDPENGASVKGEVFANSNVAFLDARDVNGQRWWQVRVLDQSNPNSVQPNTDGWIISGTVTEPAAIPVVQATPVAAVLPPVTLNTNDLELERDPRTSISLSGDKSWQPQGFPLEELSFFLAPSPDAGQGVLAAKVVGFSQDQEGVQGAVDKLAFALAKPDTIPQLNIDANDGTNLSGNIVFVRVVGGQEYTLQGRVLARPAPGSSIGVIIAFVPQNSYDANLPVLNEITQRSIFQ